MSWFNMTPEVLTSLPGTNGFPHAEGKFTLGKSYPILDSELLYMASSRITGGAPAGYAEFEVEDDEGVKRWLCCGCFNKKWLQHENKR